MSGPVSSLFSRRPKTARIMSVPQPERRARGGGNPPPFNPETQPGLIKCSIRKMQMLKEDRHQHPTLHALSMLAVIP